MCYDCITYMKDGEKNAWLHADSRTNQDSAENCHDSIHHSAEKKKKRSQFWHTVPCLKKWLCYPAVMFCCFFCFCFFLPKSVADLDIKYANTFVYTQLINLTKEQFSILPSIFHFSILLWPREDSSLSSTLHTPPDSLNLLLTLCTVDGGIFNVLSIFKVQFSEIVPQFFDPVCRRLVNLCPSLHPTLSEMLLLYPVMLLICCQLT